MPKTFNVHTAFQCGFTNRQSDPEEYLYMITLFVES